MNNKIIFGLCMALLSCAVPVHANDKINVDARVKEMRRNLNLTDDQARQVRPILQEFKNRMEDLKREKEAKLRKILSDEQMNELKSLENEKH